MVGQSPPPAPGPEWSMLAANPQRTSWTPEEVRGPFEPVWYRPIDPYIDNKVQVVAAAGNGGGSVAALMPSDPAG